MGKRSVLIKFNNGVYVAHFYENNELIQKVASYNKKELEKLRRKFYKKSLKFKQEAETRPTYVNYWVNTNG